MEYKRLVFSGHAVRRMFERQIRDSEVRFVIASGEVIASYPDDSPLPSYVILGFIEGAPLHVVVAVDSDHGTCYVVTVYAPDPEQWHSDYRTRRSS